MSGYYIRLFGSFVVGVGVVSALLPSNPNAPYSAGIAAFLALYLLLTAVRHDRD